MILNCGEPVESTDYDFLEGIARRDEHPSYPEPEVAMIFKRMETDTAVDLFEVELALRRAYMEVSVMCMCAHTHSFFCKI